jgi:long-chain acyl-CoA synthetase
MREVLAAVARHAGRAPHRPAVHGGCEWLSYGALLDAVRHTARWADSLPATVALLAPSDERAIVWHLALAWAGRTIVPLPNFFSPGQLAHLVQNAGVEAVVTAPEMIDMAQAIGPCVVTPALAANPAADAERPARYIIYTSGTTGRPKGVVLGETQLTAIVHAMSEIVAATAADRMLSVLPYALLLEQIAGIAVPLSVGASIALCHDPQSLPVAAERFAPTATVLVPEMLASWVGWLEGRGRKPPASLRFVAVGGAPVPPGLAERAWALGLPVHEGYGLSECCSVVTVNRLGKRAPGTVGLPLPGVTVSIEDGEIVVSGPTVMDGYLGFPPCGGVRRTGDAGRFDEAGRLIVEGRIDDVVVTGAGRNIRPEWIEAMILANSGIARCAVIGGGHHPRAVLCPADRALYEAGQDEIDALVAELCAEAPDYARPRANLVMSEAQLQRRGLITANGRIRRRALATYLKETA